MLYTFHINRLKLAFMSTPAGIGNTQQQLNKSIQGVNATNIMPIQTHQNHTTLRWRCSNTNTSIHG